MISDLTSIFTWWLSIFGLSLLSLPLVFHIFSKFWDKGYIFAKTISLILITYFTLILGIFKILPFNYLGLSALIIIFLAIDGLFLIHRHRYLDFFTTVKKNFSIFIIEELVF